MSKEAFAAEETVTQADSLVALLQDNGDLPTDAGDDLETAAGAEGAPQSTEGGPANFHAAHGGIVDVNAELRDRAFSDAIPARGQAPLEDVSILAVVPEEIPEETPSTSTDDSVETYEDKSLVIGMKDFGDYSENISMVSIETLPTNGTLIFNGEIVTDRIEISVEDIEAGKLVFVPSHNTDDDSSFTFTVGDGIKWSDVHTTEVNVIAVADAPTLSFVVGEGVVDTGSSFISHAYEGNGFNSWEKTGNTRSSQAQVSYEENLGYGVSNKNTNHGSQDTALENNETLLLDFGNSNGINVTLNSANNGTPFFGNWIAYDENRVEVATGEFITSNVSLDLVINPNITFRYVAFDAGNVTGTNNSDSNSGFYVNPVSITIGEITQMIVNEPTYTYAVDIHAALTDTDGSESLGYVTVDRLPEGAALAASDGVTFNSGTGTYTIDLSKAVDLAIVSSSPLDPSAINDITASVTSTENNGGDSATTTTTAHLEVNGDGDTINGSEYDDFIHFGPDTDNIYAGAGDDIIEFNSQATTVDGGDGRDTLLIEDGVSINFVDVAAHATSIEVIDLGTTDKVLSNITLNDVLNMTDGNNFGTLRIDGTDGDQVALNTIKGADTTGDWTQGDDVIDGGATYHTFAATDGSDSAILQINSLIQIDES